MREDHIVVYKGPPNRVLAGHIDGGLNSGRVTCNRAPLKIPKLMPTVRSMMLEFSK